MIDLLIVMCLCTLHNLLTYCDLLMYFTLNDEMNPESWDLKSICFLTLISPGSDTPMGLKARRIFRRVQLRIQEISGRTLFDVQSLKPSSKRAQNEGERNRHLSFISTSTLRANLTATGLQNSTKHVECIFEESRIFSDLSVH